MDTKKYIVECSLKLSHCADLCHRNDHYLERRSNQVCEATALKRRNSRDWPKCKGSYYISYMDGNHHTTCHINDENQVHKQLLRQEQTDIDCTQFLVLFFLFFISFIIKRILSDPKIFKLFFIIDCSATARTTTDVYGNCPSTFEISQQDSRYCQ